MSDGAIVEALRQQLTKMDEPAWTEGQVRTLLAALRSEGWEVVKLDRDAWERWCYVHGASAHLRPQPEGDEPDGLEGSDQDVCLYSMIVAEPSRCRFKIVVPVPVESEEGNR